MSQHAVRHISTPQYGCRFEGFGVESVFAASHLPMRLAFSPEVHLCSSVSICGLTPFGVSA